MIMFYVGMRALRKTKRSWLICCVSLQRRSTTTRSIVKRCVLLFTCRI